MRRPAPRKKLYTIEQPQHDVLVVRVNLQPGQEQSFLLTSDIHFDNAHCNRAKWKEHLDEAKERNAGVLLFGDWLCLMQGRYDPRKDMKQLRANHSGTNYLDEVTDDAAEFHKPYGGTHRIRIRRQPRIQHT